MADLGESITRELTTRYIAVLAVLGFLAVMSFVGLTQIISESQGIGERLNLTGRQRMLVERVAFVANRLAARHGERSDDFVKMLAEAVDQLEIRHRQLTRDEPLPPPDVLEIFAGPTWHLNGDLAAFIGHGRALSALGSTIAGDDPHLRAISAAAAGPLLAGLDEATARFQHYSEEKARQLLMLQGISLALVLG
ncbi:MAG: histidine kinase, partial [Magnetospirillum sp.]